MLSRLLQMWERVKGRYGIKDGYTLGKAGEMRIEIYFLIVNTIVSLGFLHFSSVIMFEEEACYLENL